MQRASAFLCPGEPRHDDEGKAAGDRTLRGWVILIATPSITATAAIKANASNFAWLIPWPAIHIFPSEELWRAGAPLAARTGGEAAPLNLRQRIMIVPARRWLAPPLSQLEVEFAARDLELLHQIGRPGEENLPARVG